MLALNKNCWLVVLALGLVGCSSSEPVAPNAAASGDTQTVAIPQVKSPQEAVHYFLDSVRRGDDKTAAMMLTALAREKTQEMNLQVAPPGSNTASFEVGEVKLIGQEGAENGAYVASKWTDVAEGGQPHTDEIMWMVSLEPEGWRIVGMGVKVFEDLEPVYLDFQDPNDMLRKQAAVEQEMVRRATATVTGQPPQGAPGASPAPQGTAQAPGQNVAPGENPLAQPPVTTPREAQLQPGVGTTQQLK